MQILYVHFIFLKEESMFTKATFIWLKIQKILEFKIIVFYLNIFKNVIYFCDAKLNFQRHYSSLQCLWSLRNHCNMLYCFKL